MLQRTAVLRIADNHGSRRNGTSNGPIAHAQSEKKKDGRDDSTSGSIAWVLYLYDTLQDFAQEVTYYQHSG